MLVSTCDSDCPFISPKGLADPTDIAQRALILGSAHETCTEGFDQFMSKLATYFAERPWPSIIRGCSVTETKCHQIESISSQMLHLLTEMLKTSSFGCLLSFFMFWVNWELWNLKRLVPSGWGMLAQTTLSHPKRLRIPWPLSRVSLKFTAALPWKVRSTSRNTRHCEIPYRLETLMSILQACHGVLS